MRPSKPPEPWQSLVDNYGVTALAAEMAWRRYKGDESRMVQFACDFDELSRVASDVDPAVRAIAAARPGWRDLKTAVDFMKGTRCRSPAARKGRATRALTTAAQPTRGASLWVSLHLAFQRVKSIAESAPDDDIVEALISSNMDSQAAVEKLLNLA